jgi:acetyl-CoA acetyltransferase
MVGLHQVPHQGEFHESRHFRLRPLALPLREEGRACRSAPRHFGGRRGQGLLQRTDLDPALLEDIILGCAYPEASQGNNVARIVGLLAGLPHEVGGMTVNRFCGSSMQAVHIAAAQIEAGMGDAFLCVGVESMTMVPQGGFNFSPTPSCWPAPTPTSRWARPPRTSRSAGT